MLSSSEESKPFILILLQPEHSAVSMWLSSVFVELRPDSKARGKTCQGVAVELLARCCEQSWKERAGKNCAKNSTCPKWLHRAVAAHLHVHEEYRPSGHKSDQ